MKEIILSKQGYRHRNEFIALVDDEDYEYINEWSWYAHRSDNMFYAVSRTKGEYVFMHRIILGVSSGVTIDHKDRDGLNNQKSNLRICSNAQNQQNKIGWGKSGYKGVYLVRYKENISYRATIQVNKKQIHLGYFKTSEAAAIAYNNAALKYFGRFARIN